MQAKCFQTSLRYHSRLSFRFQLSWPFLQEAFSDSPIPLTLPGLLSGYPQAPSFPHHALTPLDHEAW